MNLSAPVQPIDPYTSRLEANMRLLSERLAWLDQKSRQLATENEALRRDLDLNTSRIEEDARERANRIVTAAEERAAELNAATAQEVERQRAVIAQRARVLEVETRRRIEEVQLQVAEMQAPDASGRKIETVSSPAEPSTTAVDPTPEQDPEREPRAHSDPPRQPVAENPAAGPATEDEAAELRAQINELLRLRDSLVLSVRESLIGLAEELGRAESRSFVPSAEVDAQPLKAEPEQAKPVVIRIEPVDDIGRLAELESAIDSITATRTVFASSLEDGAGTIEVTGLSPPDLLAAMRAELPFDLMPLDRPGGNEDLSLSLRPE